MAAVTVKEGIDVPVRKEKKRSIFDIFFLLSWNFGTAQICLMRLP